MSMRAMFSLGNSTSNIESNTSSTGEKISGRGFSDADIDKLAIAIIKRIQSPGGFHIFEFLFGVILTCTVVYFLYKKRRDRLRHRHKESDAVEILKNLDDDSIKRILGDSHLPSWINFPDYERVGWLNKLMDQLWPSINSALSAQFREMLGPLLRDNKPSWIASLKLFRFDLGDVAPQANGVKIYNQEVDNKDQILMEVDFSWIGEQDVQLNIKPIPKHLGPLSPAGHLLSSIIRLRAGIERITVNGRVRLIWRPIMEELPIIGGMQAALVGMPTFSFDVTMYGGDVSIVPGLEAWLTQFMKETVFRPYMLPEKFKLPFSKAAEDEALRPEAILLVQAVKARHVPKMDLFSQSDPYLRIFIRNAVQMRTSTIQSNANPEWNEEFKLMIHEVATQELTLILMDYDDMNPDDTIGRCKIPIRDMEPSKTKEYWLDLDMDADCSDAPESHSKNRGFIDTVIAAEQKVADQGDRLWKKLPGVRQDGEKKCQICINCTLYMMDSGDVEELLQENHKKAKDTKAFKPPSSSPQNKNNDNYDKDKTQIRGDESSSDEEDAEAESQNEAEKKQYPDTTHPKMNGYLDDKNHERSKDDEDTPSSRSRSMDENNDLNGQNRYKDQNGTYPDPSGIRNQKDDRKNDNPENADEQKKPETDITNSEKERKREKIKGRTIKLEDDSKLKERAKDALKGGVLEIRPKKAVDLVRKPWYKVSFLRSAAQLEASVCGQFKRSASVPGSQPIFNDSIEFVLGGKEVDEARHQTLKLEVWDHKLHLNHFRGGCSLDLKQIIQARRTNKTVKLSGVRRGELSFEVVYTPAHESAHKGQH